MTGAGRMRRQHPELIALIRHRASADAALEPLRDDSSLVMRAVRLGLFGGAVGFLVTPAIAADFVLASDQRAVGEVGYYTTHRQDTLLDLARSYDLGFTQLMAANRGVDAWLPGVRRITLPDFYLLPNAPRHGIVVNLAEQRLYYFPPGGGRLETYPIGVGVEGRSTPIGTTTVISKEANPTWYPPPSIHAEDPDLPAAMPPGPDNPLGAFALHLAWHGYLIHGTNKPDGVGRNVSHGCLHLYPEDIERLFREVPVGTSVRVISEDVNAAWVGDGLYVQVHPSKSQAEEIDVTGSFSQKMPPDLAARVTGAAGDRAGQVDWAAVSRAGIERTGLPVRIADAPAEGSVAAR
jgi:L,D-transpeptidase ErfK/SrfK